MAASEVMSDDAVVHILWIEAGLGCDGDSGDSVALTSATRPTIEGIPLGARRTGRTCGRAG